MGGHLSSPATDEDQGRILTTPELLSPFRVSAPNIANTLELLLQILPVLKEAAKHKKQNLLHENPYYEFLAYFHAAATVITGHLSAIKSKGAVSFFKLQIGALANLLEGLLNDDLIATADLKTFRSERHVRLHALRKRILASGDWQAKFGDIDNIFSISSQTQCDVAHEEIANLARDLERFDENLPTDSGLQSFSDPSDAALELGAFADRVFSALSCSKCNVSAKHEARLKLGSYGRKLHDCETRHLCVLLAHPISLQDWSETAMYDIKHVRSTKFLSKNVKFNEVERAPSPENHWRSIHPKQHPCLCKTLEAHSHVVHLHRLNLTLSLSHVGFESHKPSRRTYEPGSLTQQVSLGTLLQSPDKPWTGTAKLTLSLILAYSLFYLYGGPWATERWSRKNIVFFKQGDRIPLRPFLRSNPASPDNPMVDPESFHGYPEILELCVILLEIHIGQSLESYLDDETVITTDDDLFAAASETFEREKQNIMSLGFRNAIRKCLEVSFDLDNSDSSQAPRKWLFKEVIGPIELEIQRSFNNFISIDRLDEEAETILDLAPRKGQHIGSAKCHPSVTKPATMLSGTTQSLVMLPQKIVVRDNGGSTRLSLGGAFVKRADVKSAENWFGRLDPVVNVMRARKRLKVTDDTYKPVKVAILDTGLEPDHNMADRIQYEDFVDRSQKSRKDNTSHGTISVDLILKVYVEAELFVARVFETDQTDETREPNQMAKAIDWAIEKDVDIISISAGFIEDNPQLREAIHRANAKKVLIFAAASNWGNLEGGVAYPARIKDQVFCIFCSNGALKATSNMNPEPRAGADNFAVLGEDIDVYPGEPSVSGTSMATALAAGLAARILDFARHTDSRDANCSVEQLSTRAGMSAVFRKIAVPNQKYQCIAPWLLWEHGARELGELEATKRTGQPSRNHVQKVLAGALRQME